MISEKKAADLLEKYGDELYRFAFIMTLSEETAGKILAEAFEYAAGKELFSGTDNTDKKLLLSRIYKNAVKSGKSASYDEEKYGKKSDTFNELVSLPLKERAVYHLTLYENMEEKEAEEVISGK